MTTTMNRLLVETEGSSDDVSDWGSDFDEDIEESNHNNNNQNQIKQQEQEYGDLYEIPDGKPAISIVAPTIIPDWLKKTNNNSKEHHHQRLPQIDENIKPASVYIEHVLLPTRASKDDDSKNFIETLKRKLSQKNLLVGNKNLNGGGCTDPKTNSHQQQKPQIEKSTQQDLSVAEQELVKKVKESLYKVPWFYRVDRGKAELILENCTSDGSFLVRECHHGGPKVPFTLTIRFRQRFFHIQIRIRPDIHFALGTSKQNEMHFSTVQEMIDIYRKTPLQLHSNGQYFGEIKLTHPPIVYSYSNSNNNSSK